MRSIPIRLLFSCSRASRFADHRIQSAFNRILQRFDLGCRRRGDACNLEITADSEIRCRSVTSVESSLENARPTSASEARYASVGLGLGVGRSAAPLLLTPADPYCCEKTTASVRFVALSLRMMCEMCTLIVFSDRSSSLAMILFGSPRRNVARTCFSRCVNAIVDAS